METILVKNTKVNFEIYNPGGNVTALVINKYNESLKKEINNTILDKYKFIEQVGFIKDNNLEMAGNEFCINASRCALYYLYKNNKKLELNILDKKIEGKIIDKNTISINYVIDMSMSNILKKYKKYSLVDLDGISLIFLNEEENNKLLKIIDKNINEIIKNKIKKYKIDSKAIGIVLYDKNNIYPFIWVKSIDTLYFETACGSASIAYSIINYDKTNIDNYIIKQPSGYSVKIKLKINKYKLKNITFTGYVDEWRGRLL